MVLHCLPVSLIYTEFIDWQIYLRNHINLWPNLKRLINPAVGPIPSISPVNIKVWSLPDDVSIAELSELGDEWEEAPY
jgi:hypothetical protein